MIIKKQLGRILSVVLALTVLVGSLGLLTNAETASDTPSAKLVSIADDFDLDALGTNLAYDANVSKFTNGVYDTTTGIRGVGGVTNTNKDMWGSPAVYEAYSSATADSHTQDGSGALKYTLSGANHRLFCVAPNSEQHTYYLVTFYYKGPDLQLRHYFNHNQIPSGSGQIKTVTGASDWTRVSYIVYSGSYAQAMNMGGYIHAGTAYFDDFAVYKMDTAAAEKSVAAGKLFSPDDITYASATDPAMTAIAIPDGYDFTALGTNLAADPTVKEFSGTSYKTYDASTAPNAVYSRSIVSNSATQWKTPAALAAPTLDTAASHTNDGSGVLKYTISDSSARSIRLTSSTLEEYSYYLVTYWIKADSKVNIRHYLSWNKEFKDTYYVEPNGEWTRVSYIFYYGSKSIGGNNCDGNHGTGLYLLSNNGTVYADDFAVYKLSSGVGGKSVAAKELIALTPPATPPVELPNESKIFNVLPADTKYVDFAQFGATIVTDPTVKEFDGNTYKAYYADEATGTDVANANAWWGKAVNKYQAFSANDNVYKSPKARGLLSNNSALSHTADNSGVITMPSSGEQQVYLPLPKMEAKKGYVISAWVNLAADSTLTTQIFNESLAELSKEQTSYSKGWQRVTWFYYTGENAASDYSMRIYLSSTGAVIDDINVQPLDDAYTKQCIDESKLIENIQRPTFPATATYKDVTLNSSNWPYLYDGNIDWASLGTNLITDPTVKEFNADGTYKAYYADEAAGTGVANANAWWGRAANNWQAFHTSAGNLLNYGGAKPNGALTSETKYSHTDDGSGAIIMKKNQFNYRFPLPEMEANNTYVITFWVKFVSDKNHYIRFYKTAGGSDQKAIETNYSKFDSQNWKRVTFLVYMADKTHADPFIEIYNNSVGFVDDVAVYKLTNDEYALQCLTAGKLVADGVDPTQAPAKEPDPPVDPEFVAVYKNATKGETIYDYSDLDWSTLGTNLIPDPTVKEFNADGTYKAYYQNETTGSGVANANAFWGKAVNKYQQFYAGATKPNMWFSPKARGILSNDTAVSHTNDGSGAIVLPGSEVQNYCIPLSEMLPSSYYAVTFWIKVEGNDAEMRFQSSTGQNLNIRYSIFGSKNSWQRVTMLIYTGASTFSEPNLNLYSKTKAYVDDIAVYKLESAYGAECLEAGKILYKKTTAATTPAVDGYEFGLEGNLATDGSFEQSGTANSSAKYGSKVFEVTAQNGKVTLPAVSYGNYYLVTYWVKTAGFQSADKVTATLVSNGVSTRTIKTAANNNGWTKVTAIINAGDYANFIEFDTSVLSAGKAIYVDGLTIHALPADVAAAAAVIDSYRIGVLNSAIVDVAAKVFGADGVYDSKYDMWRGLVSPVLSTATKDETYVSLCAKYYLDYVRNDKINRGFAPSGFGLRREFANQICDPAKNLITNAACDNATYWADSTGFATITTEEKYDGNTSLKVSGQGLFVKKITVKPNTTYYLSLYGMGYSDTIVPHVHFGIMDMNLLPFENPKSTYETSVWTRDGSSKQEITIKYPDGTWYNRTYQFNTEDNTEVYFFIQGIKGEMYFDDIKIFETADAKPAKESVAVTDIDTYNYDEAKFACDESDNLIKNGMFDKGTEFWKDFNGMGKFVEVVTSEGNKMLHYKGTNWGYYFLPTVKLEANKSYTFSFWYRTLNGESAKFGIVSLKNPRAFISIPQDVSINRGEWTLVSISFKTYAESEVSFAMYDKDGEAVFDKFRLFEAENGYALTLAEDMPKGGLTFADTVLGTDGLKKDEEEKKDDVVEDTDSDDDYVDDTDSDDDDDDDDDETEETEETTKKVVQKYKKKGTPVRLATWFIILMIAVAVVVLAAITFLIIFLVKKKRKKEQTAQ